MNTRVVNKPTKLTQKTASSNAMIIVVSKDGNNADTKAPLVNELWLTDSLSNKQWSKETNQYGFLFKGHTFMLIDPTEDEVYLN